MSHEEEAIDRIAHVLHNLGASSEVGVSREWVNANVMASRWHVAVTLLGRELKSSNVSLLSALRMMESEIFLLLTSMGKDFERAEKLYNDMTK